MPVVSRRFAYVHMPKCGGTWVHHVLQELDGGHLTRGTHGFADSMATAELEGRTLFGTIRHPGDWYASWWWHSMRKGHDARLAVWGGGDPSFLAALEGVTNPRPGRVPHNVGVFIDLANHLPDILGSGLSLWAWMVRRWFTCAHPLELVRLDEVRDWLSGRLGENVVTPPINAHPPPVNPWTDEMLAAIEPDTSIYQNPALLLPGG